jgi:hypothetical protein
MQATDGLALLRLRTRVIGCAMAVVLALSALVLFAPNARAAEPPLKTYIGTGTSISFGYSQEIFNENFPTENPFAFDFVRTEKFPFFRLNGVVNDYWLKLELKQFGANKEQHSFWALPVNNGCPGETTDSYIGTGPVGKGLEKAIPGAHGEAPCAYKYVNGFRLHHEYRDHQSQLENVLEVIARNNSGTNTNSGDEEGSAHPVQLITMELGANDLLHAVAKCEKEVAEGLWPNPPFPEPLLDCEVTALPGTIKHLETNIAASLFAIRNGSLFGGVNYTGKINFGGFYNPFGAVFTPGVEINPGSNFLDIVVNLQTKKTVTPFGVCYSDPQRDPAGAPTFARAFNPLIDGMPAEEPPRLQKWTNMANFTFAKGGNKAKNGPDIHPTPTGYEELANIWEDECH